MDRRIESLERLANLRAAGHISESEYQTEKRRVLGAEARPDLPRPHADLEKRLRPALGPILALFLIVVTSGAVAYYLLRDVKPQQPNSLPQTPAQKVLPVVQPAVNVKVPELCRGSSCRVLEARGWAGVEAGMSVSRAQKASGLTLLNDHHYDEVEGDCRRYIVKSGPSDLSMLVEGGIITSIEAWGGAFQTPRGVKIGDRESKVRASYSNLRQEPDIYGEPSDKKLFYDTEGGKFGVKFSINNGKVSGITVGGSSRGYVEGCL